jgi:Fur family ferric uptake transcriptional regulator
MNKELFKTVFKDKKLRMSHPRWLIYQELSAAEGPLTPQEVYQCLLKKKRKIGLTSIYRSLDLFESLGMVFKIIGETNIKYKLCGIKAHHHHIICKACGRVVELDFCDISKWSNKVTESTGFVVTDHQLSFYGYCKACQKERREDVSYPSP